MGKMRLLDRSSAEWKRLNDFRMMMQSKLNKINLTIEHFTVDNNRVTSIGYRDMRDNVPFDVKPNNLIVDEKDWEMATMTENKEKLEKLAKKLLCNDRLKISVKEYESGQMAYTKPSEEEYQKIKEEEEKVQ